MIHTTLTSLDATLRGLPLSRACDLSARTYGRVMIALNSAVTVEACPGSPGGVRLRASCGPVVDLAADGVVIVAYCGDEPAAGIAGARAVMDGGATL